MLPFTAAPVILPHGCEHTKKYRTPGGTRTRNPQIRSLMRYPLRHWGESCVTAWLGLRAALCVRLHGAMAARRIPDPKVGGSNPSGVSFCPVSGTLFALRLSARTMSRAVALRSVPGGSMAEWLRRLIRNQLGVARGSSNLSAVVHYFCGQEGILDLTTPEKRLRAWAKTFVPEVGFEPTRTFAQLILSQPPWTSRASRRKLTLDGARCSRPKRKPTQRPKNAPGEKDFRAKGMLPARIELATLGL